MKYFPSITILALTPKSQLHTDWIDTSPPQHHVFLKSKENNIRWKLKHQTIHSLLFRRNLMIDAPTANTVVGYNSTIIKWLRTQVNLQLKTCSLKSILTQIIRMYLLQPFRKPSFSSVLITCANTSLFSRSRLLVHFDALFQHLTRIHCSFSPPHPTIMGHNLISDV